MIKLFLAFTLALLTACAQLGGPTSGAGNGGMQAPPTATFEDKAAVGVRTASLVLRSATTLLQANKITVEQNRVIRNTTDLAVQGIRIAEALRTSDPIAATAQLAAALATIDALKVQTGADK